MTIDDEINALLRQAEALRDLAVAEKNLEATLAAYRADMNEENKAAYKAAKVVMATTRAASRVDREGMGIGGDVVITPESEG